MNKRFCVLLGIAILGVVISHAAGYGEIAMFYWPHRYRDVISPNFDKLGSLDYYLILLIRQLVSFSVAVFMFVSGYFVSFAGKSAGKLSWNFVKHRLVKLLIPYTIWSFVWLCFYLFLGSPLPLSSAIRLFFTKGVTNSYFYIPLLSSFYILSPFLFLFVKRNVRAFLYFCFSVSVVILSIRYLDLFFDTPWIDWCINFISGYIVFYRWIIYFGIGMGAGINLTEFKIFLARHQKKLAFITPIFFILVLVEPEVIYRATSMQISWKNTPFPFSGLLFSVSIIFLLLSYPIDAHQNKFAKFLWNLGNKSYAIYLMHFLYMNIASKLVYHFLPWLLEYVWLFCFMIFVTGLGGSLLTMHLVRITPLKKFYRYLFG